MSVHHGEKGQEGSQVLSHTQPPPPPSDTNQARVSALGQGIIRRVRNINYDKWIIGIVTSMSVAHNLVLV